MFVAKAKEIKVPHFKSCSWTFSMVVSRVSSFYHELAECLLIEFQITGTIKHGLYVLWLWFPEWFFATLPIYR